MKKTNIAKLESSRKGVNVSMFTGLVTSPSGQHSEACSKMTVEFSDTEAGDIAAVLKTVSTFHPEHLSEVVLTASNEQEKSSVESQCQELFHLELKTTHRQEDSIPSLKEEFEPLLRVPPDSGGVTDVGPTLSENIASRVRKMAQVVIDSLISVKTQDEDDQPYRKTE
ncbi:uncharacterized protein LOC124121685 isoform X2 [Haliotis rufescens]|uniref:uncharacterized protein LOC124121685 isoform X2 n=1 Tax=Haliotis rufescens TaxID=6454 RepID=UPI00201F666A|nr:uncharacterized protein LOC124121685 isoform X2 [Haliotis rufescens]